MSKRSVLEPPDPPKEKKDKSQRWCVEIPFGVVTIGVGADGSLILDIGQQSSKPKKDAG